MTIIDLSHQLEPGMPSYPGLMEPKFNTWFTHEQSATRGTYAPGITFQIATYELGGNTGTYLDAPFHRYPQGDDLAALPLAKMVNLPGVVVTALHEGAIGADAFSGLDVRGKAVLVRTDWSQRWGRDDYFRSGPFLNAEACHALVAGGATLVGIDCANIDDMADTARPAHTLLLGAGIPIVEHLRGLAELSARGFRFFAAAPAIAGGTTFTVRAFAIID